MRLIYEPRVYVVGSMTVNDHYLDEFLADHDVSGWDTDTAVGGEKLAEVGGRVCYMSFAKPRPGGNSAYIQHIKETGHGSVLEHAVWSLIFTDVSRSLTHELVRHRAGVGYSQLSQRYVDESVAEFVVPHDLRHEVTMGEVYLNATVGVDVSAETPQDKAADLLNRVSQALDKAHDPGVIAGLVWLRSCLTANSDYRFLSDYLTTRISKADEDRQQANPEPGQQWVRHSPEQKTAIRKQARQAARSVLPNATETKILVTANARAWRHMIEMRCSKHAEPEIRKAFAKVVRLLQKEAPNLFGDYRLMPLPDGTEYAETLYRKV
jgi:thymidylate synthase (FAD)